MELGSAKFSGKQRIEPFNEEVTIQFDAVDAMRTVYLSEGSAVIPVLSVYDFHLPFTLRYLHEAIYGENSSCAGRALRNIIIVQAADLIKDRVNLKGFYRRSCVGSELVDWLLEHCPFVQCRSMAIGVWQLLLDMGIMSSVDQHLYFQDTYVFYQFSSDECSYLYCEFEREEEWQNGVKLLLQLVPLLPSRAGICELSHQKIEDPEESSDEILARLTSAVQRELAAVIALKARKSGYQNAAF
ncbi:rap guanine nucleotide exchange factor 5-like [Tupaia chinensis]|uniref:rap guanine nucleotide exchange factor 5-like n=1 Tax=Tupaia chinensis TaxID=246437 RepID=UPI000FFBDD2B|nr:rap guanine nucleotide exchange factor 5-like [Tupaia chinensis]